MSEPPPAVPSANAPSGATPPDPPTESASNAQADDAGKPNVEVSPETSPAPSGGAPASVYTPSYLFLLSLSFVALVADLWTKEWAKRVLEKDGIRRPAMEIIHGRLSFVLARNPGGAWGMLHDQPEKVRKPFFVAVSVIAVIVIVSMYRKLDEKQRALKWGLPLVLGGAVGNLVDRVRYGQVVDFIDVILWKNSKGLENHWPTFNVADIAICVGVFLMAVDFLFPHKRARRAETKKPSPPSTEEPLVRNE